MRPSFSSYHEEGVRTRPRLLRDLRRSPDHVDATGTNSSCILLVLTNAYPELLHSAEDVLHLARHGLAVDGAGFGGLRLYSSPFPSLQW